MGKAVRAGLALGGRISKSIRKERATRKNSQLTCGERHAYFGNRTLITRYWKGLFWTEGSRRTSHESLRSNEIAEARHRDASKRERRRVVAQCDPVQCADGITRRERTRRGRDYRVHQNPATLVTPTVQFPILI